MDEQKNNINDNSKNIIDSVVDIELKKSYLDYAMSVIVGRALPDVRDGLKPVHRRILYAMHDLGNTFDKPYKKCARTVGEVLGKYHPHGDTSVYDALVRMAQDFSLHYPLIQGQGNFGSIDGDSAAAMRYTEARSSKLASEMMADINKDTVEWTNNFDDTLKEPSVLPSKFPNLLLNGSNGIAVGMATNIPPHNITEVCSAIIHFIDHPDADILDIMKIMPGPDFPTKGVITNRSGILNAYSTGRGKIKLKGRLYQETTKSGRNRLIINEIPYQLNKSSLIEEIADKVKSKQIEGISDLRDESDRNGMRIVIELKKDANPEIVENHLFKHTRLQVTIGIIMLALVDNQPKVLSMLDIFTHYINHRKTIITRRTQFDLKKAEQKAHILEGLTIALENIDPIIKLIKAANSAKVAKEELMSSYSLSDIQAQSILDMKLQKLTGLEQDKIKSDYKEILEKIDDLKSILADPEKIKDILKSELNYIIEKYNSPRLTEISESEDDGIDIEDLIEKEDQIITISNNGYIKRQSLSLYKTQNRGGKGIVAAKTKDSDFIEHLFVANTHSYLLIFTDLGKIYWQKVYRLPEGGRQSKGKPIINLINIEQGESITAVIPINEFSDNNFLIMSTKNGVIKKTTLNAYSKPRKGGIIAINLDDSDSLVSVKLSNGDKKVFIATANGLAVKCHESQFRPIGRTSRGVRGVRLSDGDYVVGMILVGDDDTILTVTENGYGKRTKITEYRETHRGGKGVINIQTSSRNGKVCAVRSVEDTDDLMLISKNGIMIRINASSINVIGRNTQGVRIMKFKSEDDKVVAVAKIVKSDDEDDANNSSKIDLNDNPNESQ